MNTETKNIETCRGEDVGAEVLDIGLNQSDVLAEQAVGKLLDEATGSTHTPAQGSIVSTITELPSVYLTVIRKHWTTAFTMLGGYSILDLLGTKVGDAYDAIVAKGGERPTTADLVHLPAAIAALNLNTLLDGILKAGNVRASVFDLLYNKNSIVSITDNDTTECSEAAHRGYSALTTLRMDNLENVTAEHFAGGNTALTSVTFPKLKTVVGRFMQEDSAIVSVTLPELEAAGYSLFNRCYALQEVELPKLTNWNTDIFFQCTALRKCHAGGVKTLTSSGTSGCVNLIHLEIADVLDENCNMAWWNPTEALKSNKSDLIEEGSTAQNNLQQFLQNFRDYIANRLADNGSGKTLTLSQAVFSEIWDSQGQPQVKGDGLDQLRADIHRIIRTDKQWAVNKA